MMDALESERIGCDESCMIAANVCTNIVTRIVDKMDADTGAVCNGID